MGNFFAKAATKVTDFAQYCWTGVWREPHNTMKIRVIKTISLAVRSFMDRGLQTQSASLTYSTVLAIVPALALLFAIGRGFGFQDLLESSLLSSFPAQRQAIQTGLKFVDSYLKEASSGIFVGVGILMLLWTLVSLLSTIEQAFNTVWDIKKDRNIYQKITDYIAICLLVPVLMICSSGVSIFMSTIVQNNVQLAFPSPVINVALEASPVILAWMAFSLSYFLIPNTKVQFKYAAIAGLLCAIAFQVLQLLFVNGQIYVSKYNAIYGSFSFLPLLLVWLQLSWLVLLLGCVLTYAMQNVFAFNFLGDVAKVSMGYKRKVALVIVAAIFKRYKEKEAAPTRNELSTIYGIPMRIVGDLTFDMHDRGLIYNVILPHEQVGFAPAVDYETLSVGQLFRQLDMLGDSDFIPLFSEIYPQIDKKVNELNAKSFDDADSLLVKDIELPDPDVIYRILKGEEKE